MKKIIPIILLCAILITIFISTSSSDKSNINTGRAIRIVGIENNETDSRFSDSITTSKGITFKCSLNYQIGIEENSDFIFKLKRQLDTRKAILISCNKKLIKVDYYSYENKCIYSRKVTDKEWIEIDRSYCNRDCAFALIFIKDKGRTYYAKFIRG